MVGGCLIMLRSECILDCVKDKCLFNYHHNDTFRCRLSKSDQVKYCPVLIKSNQMGINNE